MKIVSVLPLKKGVEGGDLTYFTTKDVEVGSMVTVPLRGASTLGLVTRLSEVEESKANIKELGFNLRKVLEVKEFSLFRKEYFETIIEVSKYFVAQTSTVSALLIPTLLREDYDTIAKFSKNTGVVVASDTSPKVKIEKLLFQSSFEDRVSSYKTLIREQFAKKKSIFIVLPNEHDIDKFYDTLSRGIEQFTFVLGSGQSKKRSLETIEKIMATDHGILVLGTTPFLAVPREDIKIIILEHESSTSYRTFQRPHVDLRVFVELFASKIGARLIISDTLLRLETSHRKESESLATLCPLSFRTNFEGEILVENPRGLKKIETSNGSKFKIFSENTIEEIGRALQKNNVFVFSLRKGLATMTTCRDCGELVTCDRCSAPLVLYTSRTGANNQERIFACNKCEREIESDVSCKNCRSWNLTPLGIGTDSVVDELEKYFPKAKILKLDKESAKTGNDASELVTEFEGGKGTILVGTELALFYLKNPLPLCVVASFDSLWSIPSYKMGEKIVDLTLSILRLTSKKLIIQTKNVNDSAITAINSGNLLSFVREEIADRKQLGYPPFARFIKVTIQADKSETEAIRSLWRSQFADYNPEIFSGFVSKQNNKYITNMLFKIDPISWSLPQLRNDGKLDAELLEKLESLPMNADITIDPEDLL